MHPLTKACIAIVAILIPAAGLAQAPRGIAGFKLGETIDTCREELQLETVLPIRYKPYLKEVQMRAQPGFKSGLLLYEECAHPGRIVRIKMKYADSSKAFYRELLQRLPGTIWRQGRVARGSFSCGDGLEVEIQKCRRGRHFRHLAAQ
jgi:hypothetical protein